MMRKRFLGVLAVLLCFACVAVAETFTWVGNGANSLWSTCGNWTSVGQDPDPCYSSETTADVSIDGDPVITDVVFLDEGEIIVDDITLEGTFIIDNDQDPILSKLKMESLRILGRSSGAKLTIKSAVIRVSGV